MSAKSNSITLRRNILRLAVLATTLSVFEAQALTVISPVVPVGATSNGSGDSTGGVGGVAVHGYTGGTVTLGDGTIQTIEGGFLPRVVQTNNNGLINAGQFVMGRKYFIQTLGTTDFTTLGAASNTVGSEFFATGIGVGNGVATDSANVIGGYNSLDNLSLIIKPNTTLTPATITNVLVEDDNVEGLITQKSYSIAAMSNGGSTIINYGRILNMDGGQVGNATAIQSINVGVQLGNEGDALLVKTGGSVSALLSTEKIGRINTAAIATARVYGVNTDAGGDYRVTVESGANISTSNAGMGQALAIDGGGSSNALTVENSGTLSSVRANPLLASSLSGANVLATALRARLNASDAIYGATLNALVAQSIGNVAAIYVQEELDTLTVNNHETGILETSGDLTDTLYMRSLEQNVNNEGIIRVNAYTVSNKNGMAVASVSDSLREQQLNLDNSGTITGDIAVVNGNALRYWAIKKYGVAGDELKINSGVGQINSNITNSGTIAGDIYYSNGTHLLNNNGTYTGNINVDQRDTICGSNSGAGATCSIKANAIVNHVLAEHMEYAVGPDGLRVNDANTSYNGNFTIHGTKSFTLENSGTLTGNVNIVAVGGLSGSYTNVYGTAVSRENSQITLTPVITRAGFSTASGAASSSDGFIDGTLTIRTAAGVDSAGATTTLAPKLQFGVKDGEWYKVATSYTNAATDLPTTQSNSPLLSWGVAKQDGGALVMEAKVSDAASVGLSGNSAGVINALMASGGDASARVQSLQTSAEIGRAAEQLRPEINNARFDAVQRVTDKVFGLIEARIQPSYRVGLVGRSDETNFMVADNRPTGVVATTSNSDLKTGAKTDNAGVWLQGFGFRGNQERYKSVDGYTADAYGFALGVDKLVGVDNLRVGGALSYSKSDVDHNGVNLGNRTNIDSYLGLLYGSLRLDSWYLNGTLGLGKHNYESLRRVLGSDAQGSYNAWQYSVRVDAGLPLNLSTAVITPVVAMTYSYLNQSGYAETGMGALNIDGNNTNSFRTGLGAKAHFPLYQGNFSAGLELRALWNHEFADTRQDTTANFVVGGGSFTTSGVQLARDSASLGASLRLSGADRDVKQTLLLSYDADIRDQYVGHTGQLMARFDF